MIPVALFIYGDTFSREIDLQLAVFKLIATRKNWQVVKIIAFSDFDKEWGIHEKKIDNLILLAETGKIKKVLVHDMVYFGNKIKRHIVLEKLNNFGVSIYIHKYRRETLVTNSKPNPNIPSLTTILRLVSDYKSNYVPSRVDLIRVGQVEAKLKGKHIARPKGSIKSDEELKKKYKKVIKYLKGGNYSIREIAKITNVSLSTIMKVKKLQIIEAK